MEQKRETKLTASDIKRCIVIFIVTLILDCAGALDYELNGYTIGQHITSCSWTIILGYTGLKGLGKILG